MTAIAPASSHPHQYRVMGVIGTGHAASHFFHLVVPALFPLIKEDLGVSYAELGLLTAVFFVTSGIFQTVAGFVVDLDVGWVTALYAGEVVSVWSFGVSWLVKGSDLFGLLSGSPGQRSPTRSSARDGS